LLEPDNRGGKCPNFKGKNSTEEHTMPAAKKPAAKKAAAKKPAAKKPAAKKKH